MAHAVHHGMDESSLLMIDSYFLQVESIILHLPNYPIEEASRKIFLSL